jgi:hypothetical protein
VVFLLFSVTSYNFLFGGVADLVVFYFPLHELEYTFQKSDKGTGRNSPGRINVIKELIWEIRSFLNEVVELTCFSVLSDQLLFSKGKF